MTLPIALVEWEDAYAPDVSETWVEKQPQVKWDPYIVFTVGFVIYDGPEGLVLTDTEAHEHTGQRQRIPRGMVRSVTYLNKKPKRAATPR